MDKEKEQVITKTPDYYVKGIVFLIKDDYDQSSVCVIKATTPEKALIIANAEYAEITDGDLYATRLNYLVEKE